MIVKAASGGGGRGMRVVHSESNLLSAIQITQSEAQSAFGDATVYLEKFLERPRHVEVQVLADGEVRPDFVELSRYTPHINITLSVDGTTGGEAHRAPSAIGDSNADLRTDADMLVHRSHLCRDIEAAYVSITTTRPGKAG